jgi:hypothetical protein
LQVVKKVFSSGCSKAQGGGAFDATTKLFGIYRTAASLLLVFRLFKNHQMQGTRNPEE